MLELNDLTVVMLVNMMPYEGKLFVIMPQESFSVMHLKVCNREIELAYFFCEGDDEVLDNLPEEC